MTSPAVRHVYTFADYLDLEAASNVKHEFFQGEIYAMAGGTPDHAALSLAIGAELREQLKGRNCRVFSSDLRVRVVATGLATYPDVSVVCGPLERDPESQATVVNQRVIVEVLSPSSEAYDRGDKFEHYQRIPSLAEYVLVSHREPLIEVWRRATTGGWEHRLARSGDRLRLEALDCEISIDDVYRGGLMDSAHG